jgi:peptidoglycan-N-acetylglucosamine deacetylase
MVFISFSWDDGAVEDLKLMDLSLKYNISGMFFIPATNPERAVMCEENIRDIGRNGFEIGAHTYSHSYLTEIPFEKANEELVSGKKFLEDTLGKEISHFCFPGGKLNNRLVEAARSYFKSARTGDTGALVQENAFLIKPAFHFFDRGMKSMLFNSLKNNTQIFRLLLKHLMSPGYFDLIKAMIADLSRAPGNYKLIVWGHSWEIEEYHLWDRLEDLFQTVKLRYPANIRRYSDLLKS